VHTDSETPAVSIIVPAFRVSEYIGAALDSVRAQTFTDYEIIVVNDGSPDTVELERALEPYRAEIIYLKQENRGLSGARNTAFARRMRPSSLCSMRMMCGSRSISPSRSARCGATRQ
jgi:glycosyltransferase involved in cell wall biosynthesis